MLALGFATNFIPTSVFILAHETMPTLQLAGLGLAMANIGSGMGGLTGPLVLGSTLLCDFGHERASGREARPGVAYRVTARNVLQMTRSRQRNQNSMSGIQSLDILDTVNDCLVL
jgi:hypothetical protein